MKSRTLIIAGCLLSLGIVSCGDTNNGEPGMNDSTATDSMQMTIPPADSIGPSDSIRTDTTKLDTALINKTRTDTAIISTTSDTTVKPGKTVTTSTKNPPKSSSGSKTTGSSSTPANAESHGSQTRREGEASSTESRPRR